MDIAYYISDLLGQQGELTVPNLGYFVQIRMAAYYDNQAKKFFPPHYSVQFDPQTIDEDDSLANYITGVKNISLASAKYFIEKYIANLKSQAVVEDVPFANLGAFSSDGLKLTFASTTKMDDPAFFAFRPLDVYRISDTQSKKPVGKTDFLTQPAATTPPPLPASVPPPLPQTVAAPAIAPVETAPELDEETNETYYEDEPRRRFGVWIILLIVLTLIVAGLGALYKFRPDIFNKYIPIQKTPVAVKPAPVVVKPDTIAKKAMADSLAKQDSVKKDSIPAKIDTPKATIKKPEVTKPVATVSKKTVTAVVTPPVNTAAVTPALANGDMPAVIPKGWCVITAGAFPIKSIGDKQLVNMKSRGFTQARYLKDNVGKGGNYIVILGAYPTTKEALDGIKELKATGKIFDREMSIREIR